MSPLGKWWQFCSRFVTNAFHVFKGPLGTGVFGVYAKYAKRFAPTVIMVYYGFSPSVEIGPGRNISQVWVRFFCAVVFFSLIRKRVFSSLFRGSLFISRQTHTHTDSEMMALRVWQS